MKTIVKTVHGSMLYGTDHVGSDTDIKVVYAKSLSELITDTPDCYREQTPNDTEFFSLRKFTLLLGQQQTNAIEMLFTPDNLILESSPAWEELRAKKHRLVSKNIMPFVGYAKQQARVYSEKGNSLNMLNVLLADLNRWQMYHVVSDDTKAWEYTDGTLASIALDRLCEKYPEMISRGEKHDNVGDTVDYYQILDKQFECLVSFKEWKSRVELMISRYGERAKSAAKDGAFDRKAMYHAVRIIDEAIELLDTGELIFPCNHASVYCNLRYDESVKFEWAQEYLTDRYNHLMTKALPNSTLQESIDKDCLNSWLLSTQREVVRKELLLG